VRVLAVDVHSTRAMGVAEMRPVDVTEAVQRRWRNDVGRFGRVREAGIVNVARNGRLAQLM